jgi:flagellar hook-basal body complex protein FliE
MSITPITSKITPINVGLNISPTSAPTATTAAQGIQSTFSGILNSLQSTQATSDNLMQQLSAGENVDLSQLMIATQQTDINFRVAMAIRDRLVDAYKEVMRITV